MHESIYGLLFSQFVIQIPGTSKGKTQQSLIKKELFAVLFHWLEGTVENWKLSTDL